MLPSAPKQTSAGATWPTLINSSTCRASVAWSRLISTLKMTTQRQRHFMWTIWKMSFKYLLRKYIFKIIRSCLLCVSVIRFEGGSPVLFKAKITDNLRKFPSSYHCKSYEQVHWYKTFEIRLKQLSRPHPVDAVKKNSVVLVKEKRTSGGSAEGQSALIQWGIPSL